MLNIERRNFDKDGVVVKLRGEIWHEDPSELKSFLDSLCDCLIEERYKVVLDISELWRIGYEASYKLVIGTRGFRSHGGDMKLVNPQLLVQRLFRMMNTPDIFGQYPSSEADAIKAYREAS